MIHIIKQGIVPMIFLGIVFLLMFSGFTTHATGVEKTEDISYVANCDDCKLDVYRTNDGLFKPVIVYVHGGAWKYGDKSDHMDKAYYFASHGYTFVSVGYELHPDDGYHQQAGKVASAVKWVYDNIDGYGGLQNNIILMGHSSGGHLVSLLSTRQTYLQSVDLELDNINATILLDSAGLDIIEIQDNYPTKFSIVYEPVFGTGTLGLIVASPIYYITEEKDIPDFLIFYSNSNSSSEDNAIGFDGELTDNNKNSELHDSDLTHSELNEDIGTTGDETTATIVDFLGNL